MDTRVCITASELHVNVPHMPVGAVPTIVRGKTNGRNSRPIGLLALLVSFKSALFKQKYRGTIV